MSEAPGALDVVTFAAGGCRFAIEAAQVRQLLQQSASIQVNDQPVEALLGLPDKDAQGSANRRGLLIKHPAGDYVVLVSEPVALLSLDCASIYPLPPLIAARNALPAMRGLALLPEGLIVLVDFRKP